MTDGRRTLAMALLVALLAGCAGDDGTGQPGSPGQTARSTAADPLGAGDFDGLTAVEVVQAIGTPDFKRDDGPTERLQYRTDTCVLELFLYRDAGQPLARVTHVESRNARLDAVPREPCLAAVRSSRRPRPAG
jgi:hypothetical protein